MTAAPPATTGSALALWASATPISAPVFLVPCLYVIVQDAVERLIRLLTRDRGADRSALRSSPAST